MPKCVMSEPEPALRGVIAAPEVLQGFAARSYQPRQLFETHSHSAEFRIICVRSARKISGTMFSGRRRKSSSGIQPDR